MPRFSSLRIIQVIIFGVLVPLMRCQVEEAGCPLIQASDLGNTNEFEDSGLIASSYSSGGDRPTVPFVQLYEYEIVCLSAARQRDLWQTTSVVAAYSVCDTPLPSEPECFEENRMQFDVYCSGGRWTLDDFGAQARTTPANGSATLRTDCFACLSPELQAILHGLNVSEARNVESALVTHCAGNLS